MGLYQKHDAITWLFDQLAYCLENALLATYSFRVRQVWILESLRLMQFRCNHVHEYNLFPVVKL